MALNFPAGFQWPDIMQRLGSWGGLGDHAREAEAQAIINAYTVAEAKAWLKRQVADRARATQDAFLVAQNYSAGEASTWPIKRAEAAQANPTPANCPLLNAEAVAAGRTLASVVARVNVNASAFAAFSAQCAGNRARHQDAIDALTTFAQVAAYDYSAGWPA